MNLNLEFPLKIKTTADEFIGFSGAGSVELAAVGVSVSIFNLVSKLFNVPLLNITTSFVAEEQALIGKNSNGNFSRKANKHVQFYDDIFWLKLLVNDGFWL